MPDILPAIYEEFCILIIMLLKFAAESQRQFISIVLCDYVSGS